MRLKNTLYFICAVLAFAFVWAMPAVAGPGGGPALLACDFNEDQTRDLAFGGVPTTSQADFDKTTIIVAGAKSGTDGFFSTGGGSWGLEFCGQFGSAGLVSQGVSGIAANFVRVQILNATGTAVASQTFSSRGGGSWDLVGTADVDGDGLQDLVFLGVDGTPAQPSAKVEIVVGLNVGNTIFIQTADGLFDYVGKGDADGDGDEDLFFESNDGNFFLIDLANGLAEPTKNVVSSGGFTIAAIGDLNGDGKADLVLDSITTVKLQALDGATFLSTLFRPNGGGTLVPLLVGDSDNNGAEDVFLVNATSPNSTRIDLMVSGGALALSSSGFIDTGSFIPSVLGDFDGDSKVDIAGQAPGATRLTLLDGLIATTGNFVNSNANYKVVVK